MDRKMLILYWGATVGKKAISFSSFQKNNQRVEIIKYDTGHIAVVSKAFTSNLSSLLDIDEVQDAMEVMEEVKREILGKGAGPNEQ
jgi:hypothetical protein